VLQRCPDDKVAKLLLSFVVDSPLVIRITSNDVCVLWS
jgi:hypothetical protein